MSIALRAHRTLLRQPRWLVGLLCAGLLGVIGYADYMTGPDVTLVPFYLAPIGLATWYLGRIAGTTVVLVSAVVVLSVNVQGHAGPAAGAHPYQLLWNFIVRLLLFMTAEVAIATQRELRRSRYRRARPLEEHTLLSVLHSGVEAE